MRSLLVFLLLLPSLASASPDPVADVDPFIGTDGDGQVTPGAAAPFGMIQWSPQSPGAWNYHYAARELHGLPITHLSGTGCANTGELPITPTVGAGNASRVVAYTHAGEAASPGYYRVDLANGVRAELTATARTGLGRFTFPATEHANLLLEARRAGIGYVEGELVPSGPRELAGWSRNGNFCGSGRWYKIYFVVRLDRDFHLASPAPGRVLLTFDARSERVVRLKVAVSYVSIESARRNLEAESPAWDFEAVRAATAAAWRARLSVVAVSNESPARRRAFYTALYHSFLHPNVFSDVDGAYIGFDGVIRRKARPHYANFSGWDVYRSQLPLVAWLFPDVASDIAASLVDDAAQCGALPKWSLNNVETTVMVGDPGPIAVAAMHALGARAFDTAAALRFMRHSGLDDDASCSGLRIRHESARYRRDGFVPVADNGVWGAASTTLEYNVADFAVAAFARRLGDERTHETFLARSRSWRTLFDDSLGLIRPKDAAGKWLPGITPRSTEGFVEGTAAQYTFMIPHDPGGLVARLGGPAAAVARLDEFFTRLNAGADQPHAYFGNEPAFSTPWIYLWAGAAARAQDVVRRVIDELFPATPGGLPGNDDLGATSAWLVWASLGLFPAVPGVGGLAVHAPVFREAVVRPGTDRELRILAPGAPERYVAGLEIDGHATNRPWLDGAAVLRGGRLRFQLSARPTAWGEALGDVEAR